jgi:hypothetical protein
VLNTLGAHHTFRNRERRTDNFRSRLDRYIGMVANVMPAGLLGVVMVLLAPSQAAALSQNELLKSCEAVLSVSYPENTQSIEIPAAGLPCWYYMAAVQDMSTIVDQNGQPLLGICAPSTTSLLDYVRAFVRNEKIIRLASERMPQPMN